MEEKIKELENEIINLRLAIDYLRARIEDIKPFLQFKKEQEEIEEHD